MTKNKDRLFLKKATDLYRNLAQPARLRILLALGTCEACVCHLEACLSLRQAYISQNLIGLRQAGLVTSRRDGRNIYYRIENQSLLPFILSTARLIGLKEEDIAFSNANTVLPYCTCPYCSTRKTNGGVVRELAYEEADLK